MKLSSSWIAGLASLVGVALGAFVMGQINVARTGSEVQDERITGIYAQSRLLADAIEASADSGTQVYPAIKQWGQRSQGAQYRGAILDSQGQVLELATSDAPTALADAGFRARMPDLSSGKQWSIRGGLVSAPNVVFVAQRLQDGRVLVIEKSEAGASGYWSLFSTLTIAAVALFWGALVLAWSTLRMRSRRAEEFENALISVREQAIRRVELQALEAQALLSRETESKTRHSEKPTSAQADVVPSEPLA